MVAKPSRSRREAVSRSWAGRRQRGSFGFSTGGPFPWPKGSDGTACDVGDVTSTIEQEVCNNHMLCELGWIMEMEESERITPRNPDVDLQARDILSIPRKPLVAALERQENIAIITFYGLNE
ncbi:hypothetical protein K456DRAFT_1726407 [Colletotrichum gloeosporioides 23]|nr:hypothetical protein K456DRAFT_1726407 [Colletotrichum gloeosporioides 23]